MFLKYQKYKSTHYAVERERQVELKDRYRTGQVENRESDK